MVPVKPEWWQGVPRSNTENREIPLAISIFSPPQQEKLLLTQQPAELHTLLLWCNSRNLFRGWNTRCSLKVCKEGWLHQPKISYTRWLGCGCWGSRGRGSRGVQFGIVFLSEATVVVAHGCIKGSFISTRWRATNSHHSQRSDLSLAYVTMVKKTIYRKTLFALWITTQDEITALACMRFSFTFLYTFARQEQHRN